MSYLIAGLLIFLGVHAVRVLADGWRTQMRQRWGVALWRALYSLLSLAGLALLVWGFGQARQTPQLLWIAPVGMRHLATTLTLPAFVLLAAAYVPGNRIKARVHHPMTLGVAFWATAHLLANGMLAHLVLFGSFLLWSLLVYGAARRRDALNRPLHTEVRKGATGVTVAIGVAAWVAFALWLHGQLIGVRPFG